MPRDMYLATKPPNMQAAQPARQPSPLPLAASDVLVTPLDVSGIRRRDRQRSTGLLARTAMHNHLRNISAMRLVLRQREHHLNARGNFEWIPLA